jgi:RimJ/RimL family protein N-acetyltransferase
MWKIIHIFDGDYGCEEQSGPPMVTVTLSNDSGEQKVLRIPDFMLTKNGLDVGSIWPDYGDLVLETPDLLLKKAQFSDWKDIYEALWQHEESARYMTWNVTHSEEEAMARMERTILFQKMEQYVFTVYEKSTSRAIGFAGMTEVEPGIFEETGVAFGPSYVGKGYGTQVLTALLDEAKACGGRKFMASCRTENLPSHRLQKKCGFTFSHFEDRTDPRTHQPYVVEVNEKLL